MCFSMVAQEGPTMLYHLIRVSSSAGDQGRVFVLAALHHKKANI